MEKANLLLVKEINRNCVRKQLLTLHSATNAQIAKATGLSFMTVRSILSEMIGSGEVAPGSRIPSNGGRPSEEYRYQSGYSHAVLLFGYQNGNRNLIRVRVLNLFGECVCTEEQNFGTILCDSFDPMLDRAFQSTGRAAILVLGLPGVEEDGVITKNDYRSLIGGVFMKRCRERYKVPVLFVNDVNAAVLGYSERAGARTEHSAVVAIYFPRLYNPGMGLVIGGKIYTGEHRLAGEIGHLPIGVDWLHLPYGDRERFAEAAARLLAAIICITAPKRTILYGDFLEETDVGEIREQTRKLLHSDFEVELETAASLEPDFEAGLSSIALDRLYRVLFRKNEEDDPC
jgi:predicted NBD/HSP70 family sugar kinase